MCVKASANGLKLERLQTCKNFAELAKKGYYNGVIFHRIIPVCSAWRFLGYQTHMVDSIAGFYDPSKTLICV